jgi:hypothetical protein
MPNRNGQGPTGAGSGTGRGRGLCNKNSQTGGIVNQDPPQNKVAVEPQHSEAGCRGPQGCGTGKGRRGNGVGGGRGQR